MSKVGFIGLGRMGRGICQNLISKGYDTTVFDVNTKAIQSLTGEFKSADSAIETFKNSDITFMCLPGSKQVEQTTEEFLKGNVEGKTVIDLSTSYPLSSSNIYKLFKAKNANYADVSLSGSPAEAAEGRLLLTFGGDREVYEKWLSLLGCFSRQVIYMGAAGSGNIAKLAFNYLGIMYTVLYAEIFPLIERIGIDITEFYEIVGKTKADCGLYRFYGPKIVNKTYDLGFSLELALKDATYVKRLFEEYEVPAFMLDGCLNLLRTSMRDGKGKKDLSECAATVREYYKHDTGISG